MPIIDEIGGEETVRELVETFYDLIETHEQGASILEMHQDGHGVRHAREEQFNFLCGFLGGRQHYMEKHRHMNVKFMHEHLQIKQEHADAWMECMGMAIDAVIIDAAAAVKLREAFQRVANALINTA